MCPHLLRNMKCSGVVSAPQILVLVISALHLQCLHTRYLLVATNSVDRSGSITKKHLDRLKHFAPRIRSSNKALNPTDKKIGMLVCTIYYYMLLTFLL